MPALNGRVECPSTTGRHPDDEEVGKAAEKTRGARRKSSKCAGKALKSAKKAPKSTEKAPKKHRKSA
jgi:hypothetical protein